MSSIGTIAIVRLIQRNIANLTKFSILEPLYLPEYRAIFRYLSFIDNN